jgi:hypothetical protein
MIEPITLENANVASCTLCIGDHKKCNLALYANQMYPETMSVKTYVFCGRWRVNHSKDGLVYACQKDY